MTIYITDVEPLEETYRRDDGPPRWCFRCRSKRQFAYFVMSPIAMSYYGPAPHIECTTCHKYDADLFPGNEREWQD